VNILSKVLLLFVPGFFGSLYILSFSQLAFLLFGTAFDWLTVTGVCLMISAPDEPLK